MLSVCALHSFVLINGRFFFYLPLSQDGSVQHSGILKVIHEERNQKVEGRRWELFLTG